VILDGFASQNLDKLIIDLRDNGGGYIMAFTALADLFTPKDAVYGVYVHKDENDNYTARSESNPRYHFEQIVILINGNTASASESFTAALKDNLSNVIVVGETSYGKGIAQKTITFSDGSKLRYTYAEYYRKGNVKLHQVGVTPDAVIAEEGHHLILQRSYAQEETFEDRIHEYLVARNYGIISDSYGVVISAYQSDKSITTSGILDHATLLALIQDYKEEKNQALVLQMQGAVSQFD
jgi:carboxyl-terminal processing protease